jgi:uncharacterized FlaG/YvyC family protein
MRKVALVKIRAKTFSPYDDDDVTIKLVDHITDWAEIPEEDWLDLYQASTKYGYILVELPERPQQEFVAKSIEDFRAFVKKQAETERKRQAEEKIKNKKKIEAAKKKKLEKIRYQLEQLEKEVGS